MLRRQGMAPIPSPVKVAALAAFCLAATVVAASALVACRARGRIYERAADLPAREVGIVLGASVRPSGEPTLTLRYRLQAGLDAYRAGKVKQLIVTGDHGAASYDEPNVMRRWLVQQGVPSEAVFIDHAGFRTLDSMARARLVFGAQGAVVCTQEFHLPRAIFLARHWGIDAVGLKAEAYRTHRLFNALRETLAKTRAVIDLYLLRAGPRFDGPPIPLDGPAERTHDRATGS